MIEWLLYEHEDGRYAVAPSAEAATFAHGDPKWHRVGPVELHDNRSVVTVPTGVAPTVKPVPGALGQDDETGCECVNCANGYGACQNANGNAAGVAPTIKCYPEIPDSSFDAAEAIEAQPQDAAGVSASSPKGIDEAQP